MYQKIFIQTKSKVFIWVKTYSLQKTFQYGIGVYLKDIEKLIVSNKHYKEYLQIFFSNKSHKN